MDAMSLQLRVLLLVLASCDATELIRREATSAPHFRDQLPARFHTVASGGLVVPAVLHSSEPVLPTGGWDQPLGGDGSGAGGGTPAPTDAPMTPTADQQANAKKLQQQDADLAAEAAKAAAAAGVQEDKANKLKSELSTMANTIAALNASLQADMDKEEMLKDQLAGVLEAQSDDLKTSAAAQNAKERLEAHIAEEARRREYAGKTSDERWKTADWNTLVVSRQASVVQDCPAWVDLMTESVGAEAQAEAAGYHRRQAALDRARAEAEAREASRARRVAAITTGRPSPAN